MNYTINELFSLSKLSLEFEFFYNSNKEELFTKINNIISKIKIKNENFSLIRNYKNLGKYTLYTPFLDVHTSLILIQNIFQFIENECNLDFNTNLKIRLKLPLSIQNLNIQRYILGFNENIIWQNFPDRENNYSCISLKTYNLTGTNNIFQPNIILFQHLSNYGVSFEEILQNNLIFNYIGGSTYAYDFNKVKEILEYFICFSYYCVNKPISEKELNIQNNFKNKISEYNKYFLTIDSFRDKFKDFKLLVDLKSNDQILKTYWSNIGKALYPLFFHNTDLEYGMFNLDTTTNEFQIKNIKKISNCILNKFAILDSNVDNCILINNTLFNNNLQGCIIYDSLFNYGNDIKNSKLINSLLRNSNKISESRIENAEKIECNVDNCLIINSNRNYNSNITNSIIVKKKDELL